MKKSLIFLSMCSAALLSSCGTSSHYAYSAFEDGIYYRPDKETRQELEADRQEVQGLIEKTRQEAARFSDTIMLASINGNNSITSAAAATVAPVNINVDNWYEYNLLGYDTYCSYWDWRYWDMFGPWGRYSSWADGTARGGAATGADGMTPGTVRGDTPWHISQPYTMTGGTPAQA